MWTSKFNFEKHCLDPCYPLSKLQAKKKKKLQATGLLNWHVISETEKGNFLIIKVYILLDSVSEIILNMPEQLRCLLLKTDQVFPMKI